MEETNNIDDVLTDIAVAAVACKDEIISASRTLKSISTRLDAAKKRNDVIAKAYKELREYKVMLSRIDIREMPKIEWHKWETQERDVLDRQLGNGEFIRLLERSISTDTRLKRMARLAQLVHELMIARGELAPKIKKLKERVGASGNTASEDNGAKRLYESLVAGQVVLEQRAKVATRIYLEVKKDTLSWISRIDSAIDGDIAANWIDVSDAVKANCTKEILEGLGENEERLGGYATDLAKEAGKTTSFGSRAE